MKRRALLSLLAVVAGGFAGCGASGPGADDPATSVDRSPSAESTTTDPPATTTSTTTTTRSTTTVRPAVARTVRVETVRTAPMTGREIRVIVDPDGRVVVRRICGETTAERTKRLDAAAHDALVETVLAADLEGMADTYECTGECPMDIPGKRYVVTVDGVRTEVFVEAQADTVPDGLVRIQRELGALREGIGTPSCGTITTG